MAHNALIRPAISWMGVDSQGGPLDSYDSWQGSPMKSWAGEIYDMVELSS